MPRLSSLQGLRGGTGSAAAQVAPPAGEWYNMGMSIKVCSCTHRKERHCVENMSRVGCKECDCQQYKLDDEFIQPYSKIVTGAHRADLIVEHLRRCWIDKRIACLYAVHVPSSGMVRISKTVD